MKKTEAIKYITEKGFTKRMAGKIYARAIEEMEISADNINAAIKATVNDGYADTDSTHTITDKED